MSYERALEQFDAGAFVARLGGEKESRSHYSHEYLMGCPACGSSRLRWNHEKDTWICWGCRRTGTTLTLIQVQLGVSEDDALALIMAGYEGGNGEHDRLRAAIQAAMPAQRAALRRLPQIPWPAGVERLDRHAAHGGAWNYLFRRGVSFDMAAPWQLGVGRMGWLKDYLIFPVFMDDGLVYWQGRACYDRAGPRGAFKKTLNPKSEADHATASEVLLNYDRARIAEHVVVTEGPFDALKVGPHAVALLGKAVTPAKVARLLRMRASRFTIYLDRGDEERAAAHKLARELSVQAEVYVAEPPEGFDAGDLSPEQNKGVIEAAVRFTPQLASQLSSRPLVY